MKVKIRRTDTNQCVQADYKNEDRIFASRDEANKYLLSKGLTRADIIKLIKFEQVEVDK